MRSAERETINGYCMRCQDMRALRPADMHEILMRNGRPALRGLCPTCGARIQVIGGKVKREQGDRAAADRAIVDWLQQTLLDDDAWADIYLRRLPPDGVDPRTLIQVEVAYHRGRRIAAAAETLGDALRALRGETPKMGKSGWRWS